MLQLSMNYSQAVALASEEARLFIFHGDVGDVLTHDDFLFQSATLLSGQEQPEPRASASEDGSSSEEEEEQKLDLSSTTK